jgi:L-fucose dehydrogenase
VDLGLRDKVILITGGGFGIGAAISHACASEGAIPVIVNNDGPAIQANLDVMRAKESALRLPPHLARLA